MTLQYEYNGDVRPSSPAHKESDTLRTIAKTSMLLTLETNRSYFR